MTDRIPPTDQPFTVTILPKHFVHATPADVHTCVVAQAVRATFPDLQGLDIVEVDNTDLIIRYYDKADPGYVTTCNTHLWRHDGKNLIRRFDGHWLLPVDAKDGLAVTFTPVGVGRREQLERLAAERLAALKAKGAA